MRHKLLVAVLGTAALVAGCATKNYVRQTIQPVDAKIDQTNGTVAKEQTEIDQTNKDVAANATKINAVDETATGADRRATARDFAKRADPRGNPSVLDRCRLRRDHPDRAGGELGDRGYGRGNLGKGSARPRSENQPPTKSFALTLCFFFTRSR